MTPQTLHPMGQFVVLLLGVDLALPHCSHFRVIKIV